MSPALGEAARAAVRFARHSGLGFRLLDLGGYSSAVGSHQACGTCGSAQETRREVHVSASAEWPAPGGTPGLLERSGLERDGTLGTENETMAVAVPQLPAAPSRSPWGPSQPPLSPHPRAPLSDPGCLHLLAPREGAAMHPIKLRALALRQRRGKQHLSPPLA